MYFSFKDIKIYNTYAYSCEGKKMTARWPLWHQKDAEWPNCSPLLDPTSHPIASVWAWSSHLKTLKDALGRKTKPIKTQTHVHTHKWRIQAEASPLPAFLKVCWRFLWVSFSSIRISRLSLFTLRNRVAKYSRTMQAITTMAFLRSPTKKASRSYTTAAITDLHQECRHFL